MAETPSGSPTSSAELNKPYPGSDYPDRDFPVFFADSVYSLAHGNGHVKFYLARLDPSIRGDGTSSFMPYAQVVMPERAFITTALFFDQQVRRMLDAGTITQEELSKLKAAFAS